MDNELNEQNNFIMYTTDDGQVDIEVRLEDENVWLTQNSMAELFNTTRNNITMHIKNIFEEGELQENSVSKESLLTAKDGKNYKTKFYILSYVDLYIFCKFVLFPCTTSKNKNTKDFPTFWELSFVCFV